MDERHVFLNVNGDQVTEVKEAKSVQIEMKLIDLVHEVVYGMACSGIPELRDIMDMTIEDVEYRAEIKLTLTKREHGNS